MRQRRAWESGKMVTIKEKGQEAFTAVQQWWFAIHGNTTSKAAEVLVSWLLYIYANSNGEYIIKKYKWQLFIYLPTLKKNCKIQLNCILHSYILFLSVCLCVVSYQGTLLTVWKVKTVLSFTWLQSYSKLKTWRREPSCRLPLAKGVAWSTELGSSQSAHRKAINHKL